MRWLLRAVLLILVLLFAVLFATERSIYKTIRRQARQNEARRADAIVVFGAAEYNGVPSPVLKARLDHAFELEERELAPLVITTGGSGGDPHFTEAGVGQDYLIQMGVAEDMVVAENRSVTTWDAVRAVTRMLRARGGKSCIAVSDGFHLHRVKLMFAAEGITAYGSPAPDSPIEADPFQRVIHSLRETVITTLWKIGIRA